MCLYLESESKATPNDDITVNEKIKPEINFYSHFTFYVARNLSVSPHSRIPLVAEFSFAAFKWKSVDPVL